MKEESQDKSEGELTLEGDFTHRPVLVIEPDIVVKITKITKHKPRLNDTKDYVIKNWKDAGLIVPSTIRFSQIKDTDKKYISGKIGHLSEEDIKEIIKLKLLENFKMSKMLYRKITLNEDYEEEFEPFFFKEEDGYYFREDAKYYMDNLKVIDYMDKYDSFRDFVDNEFSSKVLGGWGNTQEMDELYKYYTLQEPKQTKIGKRIWGDTTILEDTTLTQPEARTGEEMKFIVQDDGTFTIYQNGKKGMTAQVKDVKKFIQDLKDSNFKVEENLKEDLLDDTFDKRWDEKFGVISDDTCVLLSVSDFLDQFKEMEDFE